MAFTMILPTYISPMRISNIEKEMQKIVEENYISKKRSLPSKEEAIKAFSHNKYKLELIQASPLMSLLTGYRQGEFF